MDKHKQTPDILAEILGGEATVKGEQPALAPAPSLARTKRTAQTRLPSPPKQKEKIVQGWEYRVASFQDYKGYRLRFVDGKELKNWMEGPLLHEYIALLSLEGWELAAASSGERLYGLGDKHQLYFKRAK